MKKSTEKYMLSVLENQYKAIYREEAHGTHESYIIKKPITKGFKQ